MGGEGKTAFGLHFKVKFANMNKVNYQKILEQTIEKNERENRVPKLLLHSCCAPCSKRVAEQQKFIEKLPVKYPIHFVEGAYEKERFYEMAKGLEDCPEGGERCFLCYELRLREAAELAKKMQMDYFTTTLSISPLKNAEKLNEIGDALAEEYGIAYLNSDFKKKNGYKRSVELSEQYGMYRQYYCGCVFSKNQRDREIALKNQ